MCMHAVATSWPLGLYDCQLTVVNRFLFYKQLSPTCSCACPGIAGPAPPTRLLGPPLHVARCLSHVACPPFAIRDPGLADIGRLFPFAIRDAGLADIGRLSPFCYSVETPVSLIIYWTLAGPPFAIRDAGLADIGRLSPFCYPRHLSR